MDIDGFCKKIEAMVLWQRDEPTFFDQAFRCPSDHRQCTMHW